MIDKGMCDKDFIWNSSNCNCECDELFDIWEYLDYENCKCRKKLIDKLVQECSENIDGNEMISNSTLNDYKNICNFCTICILLFVIIFLRIISISSAIIYFYWYLQSDTSITNINPSADWHSNLFNI